MLHNKTSYYKEVTNDKVKSIYEELLGRVVFMEEYCIKLIYEIEDNIFVSPSSNLILNNSSKIFESMTFLKKGIEEWYKISIDSNKMRVCLVHNNLSLEHYLKNEDDYLISWDKYIIDTPVMDLYKFYRNEWDNTQFSILFETYDKEHGLLDDEKILLDIMISIPFLVEEEGNEYNNCRGYRKLINYLGKSSNVIFND